MDAAGGRMDNGGKTDAAEGRMDAAGGRMDNGRKTDAAEGRMDAAGGRMDAAGGRGVERRTQPREG